MLAVSLEHLFWWPNCCFDQRLPVVELAACGCRAEDLPHITDEDLIELGMEKRMHRKRFLRHAAKLVPDRLVWYNNEACTTCAKRWSMFRMSGPINSKARSRLGSLVWHWSDCFKKFQRIQAEINRMQWLETVRVETTWSVRKVSQKRQHVNVITQGRQSS